LLFRRKMTKEKVKALEERAKQLEKQKNNKNLIKQ
jgi:hypothetical protein